MGLISRVSSRTYRKKIQMCDKKRVQDMAMANTITRIGFGTAAGLGVSLLASLRAKKLRMWPILIGFGYGCGQGITERDMAYNSFRYEHGIDLTKNTLWCDENGNCKLQKQVCSSLKSIKSMWKKDENSAPVEQKTN